MFMTILKMTFSEFINFVSCVAALAAVYYSYKSVCLSIDGIKEDFRNKKPLLSIEEDSHLTTGNVIQFAMKLEILEAGQQRISNLNRFF
jgi:hypothetical protein